LQQYRALKIEETFLEADRCEAEIGLAVAAGRLGAQQQAHSIQVAKKKTSLPKKIEIIFYGKTASRRHKMIPKNRLQILGRLTASDM
jgi:hypothetical protein